MELQLGIRKDHKLGIRGCQLAMLPSAFMAGSGTQPARSFTQHIPLRRFAHRRASGGKRQPAQSADHCSGLGTALRGFRIGRSLQQRVKSQYIIDKIYTPHWITDQLGALRLTMALAASMHQSLAAGLRCGLRPQTQPSLSTSASCRCDGKQLMVRSQSVRRSC